MSSFKPRHPPGADTSVPLRGADSFTAEEVREIRALLRHGQGRDLTAKVARKYRTSIEVVVEIGYYNAREEVPALDDKRSLNLYRVLQMGG